ncbi:MAG TPA: replicative DNA helicase [Lutibacter sp.]
MKIESSKILPHAVDLEEAVLGALMIDISAIDEVIDVLFPEMFYKDGHKLIFKTIAEIYSLTGNVDLLIVANHLKKVNKLELVGGDSYLVYLTQKVASSAHIEFHARIIIQKYIQRQVIENANLLLKKSYLDDCDVFELLDNAYSHLNNISEVSIKPQEVLFANLVDNQIDRGRKIYKGEIKPGLPTPIMKLTERTGGWRDSELIILAARPGMGKTAFALSCALQVAKLQIPVAFFSLEMSKEKLTDRLLSMEGRIDGDKFNIYGLNDYDDTMLNPVKRELKSIPLILDDTASLTIEQFQIKAKRLKNKHSIKFIVLDYLQLMIGKGTNREQEISKISRGLKLVAKELNIPIIALSQLSRAVETRGGSKRPLLSDLRESGAIEQDADEVVFLYRPEYYGIIEWDDEDYNRESTKGQAEVIVSKNRNGALGKTRMNFEGRFTLFSDLECEEFYE